MPAAGPRRDSIVPMVCLAVFLVVWSALAIAPRFRADWLLENGLTFWRCRRSCTATAASASRIAPTCRARSFSCCTRSAATHTYSEVPLGDWVPDAFGLARNHYDRVVHFAFGALLLRPVRELGFGRGGAARRASSARCTSASPAWRSGAYFFADRRVADRARRRSRRRHRVPRHPRRSVGRREGHGVRARREPRRRGGRGGARPPAHRFGPTVAAPRAPCRLTAGIRSRS